MKLLSAQPHGEPENIQRRPTKILEAMPPPLEMELEVDVRGDSLQDQLLRALHNRVHLQVGVPVSPQQKGSTWPHRVSNTKNHLLVNQVCKDHLVLGPVSDALAH